MCRNTILGMALAILAGWPAAAQRMPPESRPRAEQYATWRAMLSDSDRALGEGRLEEAEAGLLTVIEQARAAKHEGLLLARAIDRLADLHVEQGELEEAELLYTESAGLWARLLGETQPRLGVTLHNLGVVYLRQERVEQARGSLRRALAIFESSIGERSPQAIRTRQILQTLDARGTQPQGLLGQAPRSR